MIKELVKDKEQLSKRAVEWDVRGNQDLAIELIQNLDDTMEAHKELIYLCANEIGYKERAINVKFADDSYTFMNPLFQKTSNLILSRELDRYSGVTYLVPRYSEIELVYQDCLGATRASKFTDDVAIIMCQAMDTLDGLYSSDYGLEVIPEFDQATEEEQQEVINEYFKSLQEMYNKLDDEISNDADVRDAWKAAKFAKAVADGTVTLEEEKPLSKRKQKLLDNLVKKVKQQQNKLKFWRRK